MYAALVVSVAIGEWGMCGNVYTANKVVAIASIIRGILREIGLTSKDLGPLKTEHLSQETILNKYEK